MLLRQAEELELSASAVLRLRWFEYFYQHGENASLTCRYFGIARSTLVRWLDRFRPDDPSSLEEHSRRPHSVRRPETAPATVARIGALRRAHPLMGKEEISEALAKEGIDASASTVGRVIAREGFFFADTPAHRRKRAAHADQKRVPADEPDDVSFPLLRPRTDTPLA